MQNKVFITDTTNEMAKLCCDIVINEIISNKIRVIGFATGSTQIRLYHELVKSYKNKIVDFSDLISFNLDEYYKINPDFSLSYRYFMDKHFFNHINIKDENINFLDGLAKKPDYECLKYEEKIKQVGGIDCQILGLGVNGHIAFCEPGTDIKTKTMLVKLDKETIKQNSDGRFYKNIDEVPTHALTMGIDTIFASKKIIVLANGPRKSMAVRNSIEGNISLEVPASILQKHQNVTWIIESEAASELKNEYD